ncbi:flagellar biosynthetic protein FliR [Aliagarivorans marinus]|uniref:flagellar biosynthetic protein FliR n=1 Tax=Aliagarivorans marinus TaxID=561965 RepID=UPI0003FE0C8C|nr:flagellar biosynthetic protein FliR [Aliagarivorans marinus]
MNIAADIAIQWLGEYLWALTRVSAMLMTMASFGGNSVPVRVRMAMAAALTFAIVPVLPPVEGIPLFSFQSVIVVLQQVVIGGALGFVSQLLMQTFVVAGQVLAMQTSLGFASMVDPSSGQSTPVVGQFYLLLATLLFLVIDGHLQLITLLAMSFESIPIGMEGLGAMDFQLLAGWYSQLFLAALAMAMSSIVAMLLVNFSFGIMTRAAPQLNIFSIGFAVSMLFGLLILWLTIGGFLTHFERQWINARGLGCTILQIGC